MNSEYSLRALLREYETPQMVANHLGVAVQAVYSQMRQFRIYLDRGLLRRTLNRMMGEAPGLSVDGAADRLGVSRQTARRAMDHNTLPVPANASEDERRIRAALEAAGDSPSAAALTLRLELTVLYERMNEHGIYLPARRLSVAERRRIVHQIRRERPEMSNCDIAMLVKMSKVTILAALRDLSSDPSRVSRANLP